MDNKGKLAEARHVHRQLPEILHLRFRLLFCFISLIILCISALAQENNTDYWMEKGDALRALGRNEEALDAYNKGIEVGPNWGTAWHGRGEAQRELGQVFNASISFSVAEKLGYKE